ncbi:hypothetical protein [Nitrospirillum sp. BR 11163]|uniref:hypothetical protein n=1 Tax=Nitrospirillum sp. BR 11163 TaxID=3104323 RepID=UPI002AFF94BA|nr:hypothetical protein [Nitrospirillum sp. BR 11163]MEA1676638.1 hypothetical protein [Nitrospirillum sp. BR 11163]
MSAQQDFTTTLQLNSAGDMDKAEDWIRANIRGRWAVEFLGMEEKLDPGLNRRSQVLHVSFRFGLREDLDRFKRDYAGIKTPGASAGAKRPAGKTAAVAKPKNKGLFAWLRS